MKCAIGVVPKIPRNPAGKWKTNVSKIAVSKRINISPLIISSRNVGFARFCTTTPDTQPKPQKSLITTLKVTGTSTDSKTVLTSGKGNHKWTLDEPKSYGGTDEGPTPLETVLGAFAGCEAATAKVVSKKMKFEYGEISWDVSGDYDRAAFVKGWQDAPPTHFQVITVNIKIKTPESDERLKEFAEQIEKLCPVASLLHAAGVKVNATWTKEQ